MGRDNGVLGVFDLKTGEELYKRRIPGRFTASPVAADGRIYYTNEDGGVLVIAAGREFEVLAESELGASTLASPAPPLFSTNLHSAALASRPKTRFDI